MERATEAPELEVVDLGAASAMTQGNFGLPQEVEGRQIGEGISED